LLTFTQFGAEVDKTTLAQLNRGQRMVEILKQEQYAPLPVSKQVMIIYAGIKGYLDDLPVASVRRFEAEFYKFIEKNYPDIENEIETKKELSESLMQRLDTAIGLFKSDFLKSVVN
jgi:F-type H+-transporting ATPase subunit alpha